MDTRPQPAAQTAGAKSRRKRIPRRCSRNFPSPRPYGASRRDRQPEFEAQPDEAELQEIAAGPKPQRGQGQPQQVRRDRNRRRGRRGRGSRQPAAQAATASQVRVVQPAKPPKLRPRRSLPNPSHQPASVCQAAEGRRRALHWTSGLGQEHLVQAPQHSAACPATWCAFCCSTM